MPHTIRRLAPADLALFRALNALYGEAFDDPETHGAAPPSDAHVARLLAKEHVFALVALAGGEVIGGLTAYALDKLEQERSELYIYDLAVAAAHRRRGVATALIATVGEMAAASGAWVMFVQADYADPPAVALYSKLGTREEVLHFDIPVEGRG